MAGTSHSDSTEQHQLHDSRLEYADEATLQADTPAAALYGRIGYATSEDTYWLWTASGWVQIGGGGGFTDTIEDAINNAVTTLLTLAHNTTGSPAAGIGTAIELQAESTTTEAQQLGQMLMDWAVATHASREAQFRMLLNYAGTAYEAMVARMNPYAGTAVGNARGEGAFDFQTYRDSADQVASEEYSSIWGGSANKNAGVAAAILGGDSNEITSGGWHAAILGSFLAKADKRGQIVSASGMFSAAGDAQGTLQMVARRSVTHSDANWYELFLNGSSQRMTIPTDTAWTFDILLVGATSGQAKTFGFRIDGVIKNDGGTTSLLASNVTTLYDTDDTSFDARVSADDTNDALIIEVSDSDGASDVVRWVATIRTAEVTYG